MHLAHANAAVMLGSYDDPLMADFVALLDPVNAAADASPGFVWRLDDDDANDGKPCVLHRYSPAPPRVAPRSSLSGRYGTTP